MEKMLHTGQYEELLALFSYFNWLQSAYGPIADGVFNIFQTKRQDFRDFIDGSFKFNVRKPIFYTVDGTLFVTSESVLQITDGCHGHSIMTQGEVR